MYELFFKNISKHIALTPEEQRHIIKKLQVRRTTKNEILLQQGETCREMYFVESGCLRIYQLHADGAETNILFCPENWWASDGLSFANGTVAEYGISSLEDSTLVSISAANLQNLFDQIPKLERFFRLLFQNAFGLMQRRLNLALSTSSKDRFEIFYKQYPTLIDRISQKHIASYLGITPVFLSILRKRRVKRD
jgi:CRP-like cAMP-binding protein